MIFSFSQKFHSFCLLLLFCANLPAQVKMTEEIWTLPTYEVMPGEKAPMFFNNGNFQGAQRVIYPYAANDVISNKKINKDWQALILENEYIKLCVTPEIGGKLYYATDKTNNYNFIYKNNEVKPANIGMTGAWVSGGIEWCVLHHHRASTFLPMDYDMRENEDGSKTIFIGETEPRHRMRWNVGVTVRPGKSYFEAEVSIYNPTPYTHNFLYWANVAAHANDNYQTIFPPSVEFATFHQKVDFTQWPISNSVYMRQDFTDGVDISWWKNVKKHASFFAHNLQEDFMGGYDHGKQAGTVHIGDHNIVKGAKLWEWGSGKSGQATEGKLTETSGPYVEIMVGAFSDNQPDYTWIRPYEVKRWKQYWYPVKDIQGFKNANIDAAVNLEQRGNNSVFLGYHSTQTLENARVILKKDGVTVFEKDLQISPEKSFTKIIGMDSSFELEDLYTELYDLDSEKIILSYRPKKKERRSEMPKKLKPPVEPKDVKTIEELYLIGSRMEQFYKTLNGGAMAYFNEGLMRDPNDIRINIAVGNTFLKKGDFKTARQYLGRAIKRQTRDYTRPSNGEGLYLQGVTLKAMNLYEAAIDTLYRASWDYAYHSASYFQLAQISSIQKHYKKALMQIDEAISTNDKNTRLHGLKASLERVLGDYKAAQKTISNARLKDPLNFRIEYESYLLAKSMSNAEQEKLELIHFKKKMRDFEQNYLDLATEYVNEGFWSEAKDVLLKFNKENPIPLYYLGFIENNLGDSEQAKIYFEKAESLSEESVFPYRLETIRILNKALEYNPKDKKAYYYLGNILYDKQPELAISYWEKAVQNNKELAMAYRNLGWGYYNQENDIVKAIDAYEKAMSYDDTEANFYNELDQLYDLNNSTIKTRLDLFDGKNEYVKRRDDAFVRQMKALTLADQSDKVITYLEDKTFSYREGTSEVRELIIDTYLTNGIQNYDNNNYKKALESFLQAQVPDEEAGSARYGNRQIQVNYYIGLAYEALGDQVLAKQYFESAIKSDNSGEHSRNRQGFMSYYKGLSYEKLNKQKEAKATFKNLIESGNAILKSENKDGSDYFKIFGQKEHENTTISMAYTMKGLGHKGLDERKQAKSDLEHAVNLLVSNLWAQIELKTVYL